MICAAAEGGGGPVDLTFPLVCVFTVWLEPILSKTAERNQIKGSQPATARQVATPQKNTLCSFHFARAGFLFLLMKRVFFCGVLPSKYSGRWRTGLILILQRKSGISNPLPLFLCSNGTGTEAGGQKFLPPTPSFCPPAWASPQNFSVDRFSASILLL